MDLVAKKDDVVLFGEGDQALQFLFAMVSAQGVMGIAKDEKGNRTKRFFEFVPRIRIIHSIKIKRDFLHGNSRMEDGELKIIYRDLVKKGETYEHSN